MYRVNIEDPAFEIIFENGTNMPKTGNNTISTLISDIHNCTARQCSPLRRTFMECYIIKPAQSLLMKHLVIGQR